MVFILILGEMENTRSQKFKNNLCHLQDPMHPLDMSGNELANLQQEDETLNQVQKATKREVSTVGSGFFPQNGIIYRKWPPPGLEEGVEQSVLPLSCRRVVLQHMKFQWRRKHGGHGGTGPHG